MTVSATHPIIHPVSSPGANRRTDAPLATCLEHGDAHDECARQQLMQVAHRDAVRLAEAAPEQQQ